MTEAFLSEFRRLADQLAGPEPRDWQWVGPHMSQRMFGITEARARAYAARHGGAATKMAPIAGSPEWYSEHPRGVGVQNSDGTVTYMTDCPDLPGEEGC